ncbi:hypothetical protein Salat_1151700 [Sesamum alatum]|uniref:Uncharacterized protein n=1 Tax=Sesamum alatum TaxID=300844 RepID=A0AAE1YED2_9LAMI|nr:hypothetical protein Salat_1151700 [Sesamum alatum]
MLKVMALRSSRFNHLPPLKHDKFYSFGFQFFDAIKDTPEVDVGFIQPTAENEKQLVINDDAIFEANDGERIFKIADNVVDEIRSQQPIVEVPRVMQLGVRRAIQSRVGKLKGDKRGESNNGEDEVVENYRISVEIENYGFSDSIEREDNDVDFEDDDAENRKEVVRDVYVKDASIDFESASYEDMVGSGDNFESEEDNERVDGIKVFNASEKYDPT